nr:MAG TPA: hypothetical protein [Caudoviricetes sp.]
MNLTYLEFRVDFPKSTTMIFPMRSTILFSRNILDQQAIFQ